MRLGPWAVVALVLVVLGIAFHVFMGLRYGSWTDVGVYSISVTLVGFGVGGLLATGGEASST